MAPLRCSSADYVILPTLDPMSSTADAVVGALAAALALVVLYAVFLDQGALLAPFLGADSSTHDYLHELTHDARHLLGVPSH